MSEKTKQVLLIIDDSKDFLEIFSTKLKSSGFEVFTAISGEEGIKMAGEKHPDLILLDVQMPNMTGIEALSRLKENAETSTAKVVFLTNYGEPQKETTWIDEKFAREAGAMDYIKKSEDLEIVVKEVKRILATATH